MWLWKHGSDRSPKQPLQESPFTAEEMARLRALRLRFLTDSEYLLPGEKQRLVFVKWLVEQGKLSGDRL